MRNPVRGWRSARTRQLATQGTASVAAAPMASGIPVPYQERARLGLGLVALAFYVWVIHSYKLPAGDVAVLSLAVGVLLRGGQLRVPPPLLALGGWMAWGVIGLSVTADNAVTTTALIDLVKLWIIAFCTFNIIRNAAELRFLTIAWLAIYALYPIRGALYNHFICNCTEYGRVAWNFVFINPNDLAALSLIPLGVAAGVATVERVKLWRYAAIAGVLVLMLVVLLTQSRGAMIGLGLAVILLPLTSRRRARDMALTVAVLGVAAAVAPKDVWRRVAGLGNVSVDQGMVGVDEEGSAQARWTIWTIAGEVIRDNPVTGVGLGMMPETSRRITGQRGLDWSVRGQKDTHSTYLRIAAETGVPGLLIYLALWGTVIVKLRRARRLIKYQRPGDTQFLVFIELSVWAFLGASLFGTYGMLSFTYLMVAVVWLSADILAREPWYVPSAARAGAMAIQSSGRRR